MAHDVLRKLRASFREMETPIKVKIYDPETDTIKDDEIIPAIFAEYCDNIKSKMRNDPKLRTVIDRFPHPIIWTIHPSVKTAASDGVRIAFNPVFANFLLELGKAHASANKDAYQSKKELAAATTKYLEFVILHECFHEIYRHSEQADIKPETQNGNNHHLANIAMDAEINRDIERAFNQRYAGCAEAINGIFDPRFDYESWWQIFDAYYSGAVDPPEGESNDNMSGNNGDSEGEDPQEGQHGSSGSQSSISHSSEWERGYKETMEAIERGEINPEDYAFISNFEKISPSEEYENGKKAAIKDYLKRLKQQNNQNNAKSAQSEAAKAQQAADKARQAANRGDEQGAKDTANQAGDHAKNAADAAQQSGANSNDVNNAKKEGQNANDTANDSSSSAQDAADAAQAAADAAQQAADAAQDAANQGQGTQGGENGQGSQEGQDSQGETQGEGNDGSDENKSQEQNNTGGPSNNSLSQESGDQVTLDTKDYSWDIPNVFGGADRISKEQMAQIAEEAGEGYSNTDLTADPKELSRRYNDSHEKEFDNIKLGKDKNGNDITLGDKSRNLKDQLAGRQTFADWKTKMANHFHEAMKGATEFKRKRKAVAQIDWYRGYANIMKEIPKEIKNAANVFYLIDNSGSMGGPETFTQIFAEILKLEKKCHIAHSALTYFGANDSVEISKIRLWDYKTKREKVLAMIPQYNDYGGGTNILDNVISVRRLKTPYYYDDKSGHKTVLIVITDGYDNLEKIKKIPRKELRETIWLIINGNPMPILTEIHKLGAPIKNLIGIDTGIALGQ